MLREGGQALFCPEEDGIATTTTTAKTYSPQIALVREYVLKCKCLGPSESEWMGRTFRVTSYQGVLGGRRRPEEFSSSTAEEESANNHHGDDEQNNKKNKRPPPEFVQFTDATVSRKHFEIRFIESKKLFAIRDCGSAGGTFLRIPPCQPVIIQPGMRIMLGKHQLEVCKPPLSSINNSQSTHLDCCNNDVRQPPPATTAANFEHTMTEVHSPYHHDKNHYHTAACARRRKNQNIHKISNNVSNGMLVDFQPPTAKNVDYHDQDLLLQKLALNNGDSPSNNLRQHECTSDTNTLLEGSTLVPCEEINKRNNQSNATINDISSSLDLTPIISTDEEQKNIDLPLISLKCFAPEGTPIQGNEYLVGKTGATIGRKVQNTISFCHRIADSYVGIDNSISGEHANITYNEQLGVLELRDGPSSSSIEEKQQGGRSLSQPGSTNGTWIRLSGLHEESEYHHLHDKTEILIGTVRFLVTMEEVIVERDIYSDREGSIALL
jgi:pSer/pThr/pTyr-binding forkhead associated (FHA) protein